MTVDGVNRKVHNTEWKQCGTVQANYGLVWDWYGTVQANYGLVWPGMGLCKPIMAW
jgi:hypothetical protein